MERAGRVAGKVALVTGAGSGIGRATALVLAAHGAAVHCADVRLEAAEETAAQAARAGGKAFACAFDVTVETAWEKVTADILTAQGRLDVAVNCAGISAACPIAELALDEWRRVLAVNLDGVFLGTKHAIRAMTGRTRAGSIVNVSSVSGVKAHPGAAAYCTSKAAILMLTKTAALECLRGGLPIRVNAVSPSGVKTPLWRTMPFFQELMAKEGGEEQAFAALAKLSPHGRWAEPEEIALAILYLASDESLYVNGTNLLLDNGDTA